MLHEATPVPRIELRVRLGARPRPESPRARAVGQVLRRAADVASTTNPKAAQTLLPLTKACQAGRSGGLGAAEPRAAEPGRIHHEGIAMNPFELPPHRPPAFLSENAGGGHRHDRAGGAAAGGRGDGAGRQSARAPEAAFRRPRRRTSSSCSWRAARARWICSIPSRSCRSGTASRCRPSMTKDLRLAFTKPTAAVLASPRDVQAVRPERHRVLDYIPHIGFVRRRHLPGALHVHRRVQSPSRPVAAVQRHRCSSAVRRWAPGCCTASAANRRICPASWCWLGRRHQRRRVELVERLSALDVPGHDVAQFRRPGAVPVESRRRHARNGSGRLSTRCGT